MCHNGPRDYDRVDTNSDGSRFYGYDNDNGTTDWYSEDNRLDSTTSTPSDDD